MRHAGTLGSLGGSARVFQPREESWLQSPGETSRDGSPPARDAAEPIRRRDSRTRGAWSSGAPLGGPVPEALSEVRAPSEADDQGQVSEPPVDQVTLRCVQEGGATCELRAASA